MRRAIKIARQVGLSQVAMYGLYKIGLRTGQYQLLTETHRLQTEVNGTPLAIRGLFTLPDQAKLAEILGEEGQRALVTEADEIVAGKFRMFGGGSAEIKLTFDQPLQHWTHYETGKISLSSFISPYNDIKFIWEPARFGWAYVLGRAYHLTLNETYAETFWKYFETFTAGNPPNLGPHWMNGQEVAIRLMAFVWAGRVFENPASGVEGTAAASSVERRALLAGSIAAHAARILPTLPYARAQNNNHLVTEAAGLYTAGLALPDHPRASRWRALGWRWLNWAFRRQISDYGEYIQHSTNYHRVMLQMALWVHAIKDVNWSALTLRSLGRATHWLFSMLDPASGRTPNLGANDGALILPLAGTPFNDFRPTVQAAARAFLRFQMPGGVWDEMSSWLGLDAHEKAYEPSLYLADQLRGRDSWAYLRTSTFPSRLGHMDQLHLDLWWRGLNVAQDAGTYLYNADPPWDNPLVTSFVHNTVTVDGHDQMTRGGRFMTLDWFPAYAKSVVVTDEAVLGQVLSYHKGYRGIRHERRVTVYADERWVVEDRLTSKESHTYCLHWLLPDWECKVENREQQVEISLKSSQGKVLLILRFDPQSSNLQSLISIVRAGEVLYGVRDVKPFEGWVSPTYGEKHPALSLAFEVQSEGTTQITTEFIFPHEN
ncbi:MAG: alginate lyase family protein [Anaerolineales bacterium]